MAVNIDRFETGPRPLTQEQTDVLRVKLGSTRVSPVSFIGMEGSMTFFEHGTFRVKDPNLPGWFDKGEVLWSAKLLNYNPREVKIKTSRRGNLLVIEPGNDIVVETIRPSDVRFVDAIFSGKVRVSRSGYLIDKGGLWVNGVHWPEDEADQILADAEKGVEPPGFCLQPFLKADPALSGKSVVELFLSPPLRPDWRVVDGIAIDQNRKLVPVRQLGWILDKQRWQPAGTN